MIVHPRENELVIATHGRSVYLMDVAPLQKLSKEPAASFLVFEPESLRYSERWGERRYPYLEPNIPSARLMFFAPEAGTVQVKVLTEEGGAVYEGQVQAEKGFNRWSWNVQRNLNGAKGRRNKKVEPAYLEKGVYTIRMNMNKQESETKLEIK